MKKHSRTAEYLALYLDMSPYTQKQIAEMVGYDKANVLSMFKKGNSPVPIGKVPKFAEVLRMDAKKFLRIALEEYHPELLKAIELIEGDIIAEDERSLLNLIRSECGDIDMKVVRNREKVREHLAALAQDLTEGDSTGEADATSNQ